MALLSSRRAGWLLTAALLAAVGLRLALALSPDSYGDLRLSKVWADGISARGLPQAYEGLPKVNYPPVLLYPIGLAGWVYRQVFSPAFSFEGTTLTVLLKLPSLAADLALAALIYYLLRRYNPGAAARGFLLYAFNPAVLLAVAWAGYPDTPHAFLAIVAVVLADRGRPALAAASLAAALLTKPQAAVALPVVAVLIWRQGGANAALRGLMAGVATVGLIVSPFLLAGTWRGPWEQLLHTADYQPVVSAWAHNIWWLFSRGYGLFLTDQDPFLGPISRRAAGLILFGVFAILSAATVWQRRSQQAALEATAFCALAFFLFATQVHENHLFLALPLLAVLAPLSRRHLLLYGILSATFMANIALHQQPIVGLLTRHGWGEAVIELRRWNSLVNVAVFLGWAYLLFLEPLLAKQRAVFMRVSVYTLAPTALLLALGVEALLHWATPWVVSANAPSMARPIAESAVFGDDIRLLGHSGTPAEIKPGTYYLTLYWQALDKPPMDYQVFIHVTDLQGEACASDDGPPASGIAPTAGWRPGDFITDRRLIRVADACTPGVYRWLVGLYDLGSMQRLPLNESTPTTLDLGESKLPLSSADIARPRIQADVRLGEVTDLVGYSSERTPDELIVTLFWRAAGDGGEYTVFVHLVDSEGQLIAQHDGPPRYGSYPTRLWAPDELVPDEHRLLWGDARTLDGYFLSVGMYDPRTLERLPVIQDGRPRDDRAARLPLTASP